MPDDRERVTTRLQPDVYDQLCDELPSFDSDTARLKFVVQFYLDYKELGHPQPPAQIFCEEMPSDCGGRNDETNDDKT
jgi:hypothetical protein